MKADEARKAGTRFVSAVIVAAGNGTRMGGISKPEIRLDGKTLFARVLTAFLASCVREIIVVCGENRDRLQTIAAGIPANIPIRYVTGGKTRTESVFCGVSATDPHCEWVCIHDCARPFVTSELIDEVISAAIETGAATACAPVTDTIKFVDEEQHAIYTPAREHLLSIMTPQACKPEAFLIAYAQACKKKARFTDESSLLESMGAKVAYVQTDLRNIKLTTKSDLILARAILAIEKSDREKSEQP